MKIRNIISHLEQIAPISFQENYDNSGLIVGDAEQEIKKVLFCLDSTEEVVQEAIEKGCQLIIAHHPIIFSGLKKLTGKNYIERTIIKAIKHDVAIYACHTNLDNILKGVNYKIGAKLGLENLQILSPKLELFQKLIFFVPITHQEEVRQAVFDAGAGHMGNYDECSFNSEGIGTFRGNQYADAFVGQQGVQHHERELKIEVIVEKHKLNQVITALLKTHPYEEVAYDVITLQNQYPYVGSGMIGELSHEMNSLDFLKSLKTLMNTSCVKHTKIHKEKIKTVAFCGGAGSFLLSKAIAKQADIFITGDYKYHEFFDAEDKIIIADIGHYESEQFTIELFQEILEKQFPEIKFHQTNVNTNPVNYL